MGTSAARKIYDWDKKMNEMASARYLPYNQCNANTDGLKWQMFTFC